MVKPVDTETSYNPAVSQTTTENIKKGNSFKAHFAQGPFGPFIPAATEEQQGVPQKAARDPFIRHLTTEYFGAEYHSSLVYIHDKAVVDAFSPPRKSFLRRVVTAPFAASTWRMKMLPPLSAEIFISGVKTLPSRVEEKEEKAASNNQGMVPASLADKVQRLDAVADKLDALLREQILNTNKLSVEDRKKDLDLIKDYQRKVRAAYTAPETIVKKKSTSAPPLMLNSASSAQSPSVPKVTMQEARSASHSRHTTVCEIVDGEEDFEYIDTVYTPGAHSYATTIDEIPDESEAVESLYRVYGASEVFELAHSDAINSSEQTFAQAWAALKETARNIKPYDRAEDTLVQKACGLFFSVLYKLAAFSLIPGGAFSVDMLKLSFEFKVFSSVKELTYKNVVREALKDISTIIISAGEEAIDMNAVSNINSFTTETAVNLASATGAAMQVHTEKLQKDLNNGAAIIINKQDRDNAAILDELKAIKANQQKLAKDVAPLLRPRSISATSINSTSSNGSQTSTLVDSVSGSRTGSPDLIHKAEVQEIVDKALKAQEEKHAKEIAGLKAGQEETNNLLRQLLAEKIKAATQGN